MWKNLSNHKKVVIGLGLCLAVAAGMWQFQWRTKVEYYEVKTQTIEQLIHTEGVPVPKSSKWYSAETEGIVVNLNLEVGTELSPNESLYEIKTVDYRKRQGTIFALFNKACDELSAKTTLSNQEAIGKIKDSFAEVNKGMYNSWGAHEKVLTLFESKAVNENASKESLVQLKDEISYYNKETSDLIAKLVHLSDSIDKENGYISKLESEWTIMTSIVDLMSVKVEDGKSTAAETFNVEPQKILVTDKGVVTRVGAENGQYILKGTPVIQVSDSSQINMEMEVPVDQIMALKSGAEVRVTGTDAAIIKGKVTSIDNVITEQMQDDGSILKCVKVTAVMDPNAQLKFFTAVKAELVVQTQKDAAVVPKDLVFKKGDTYTVWVNSNGVLSEKKIEVSFETPDLIVIKSGIKSGDKLVMDTKLRLGQKIKF